MEGQNNGMSKILSDCIVNVCQAYVNFSQNVAISGHLKFKIDESQYFYIDVDEKLKSQIEISRNNTIITKESNTDINICACNSNTVKTVKNLIKEINQPSGYLHNQSALSSINAIERLNEHIGPPDKSIHLKEFTNARLLNNHLQSKYLHVKKRPMAPRNCPTVSSMVLNQLSNSLQNRNNAISATATVSANVESAGESVSEANATSQQHQKIFEDNGVTVLQIKEPSLSQTHADDDNGTTECDDHEAQRHVRPTNDAGMQRAAQRLAELDNESGEDDESSQNWVALNGDTEPNICLDDENVRKDAHYGTSSVTEKDDSHDNDSSANESPTKHQPLEHIKLEYDESEHNQSPPTGNLQIDTSDIESRGDSQTPDAKPEHPSNAETMTINSSLEHMSRLVQGQIPSYNYVSFPNLSQPVYPGLNPLSSLLSLSGFSNLPNHANALNVKRSPEKSAEESERDGELTGPNAKKLRINDISSSSFKGAYDMWQLNPPIYSSTGDYTPASSRKFSTGNVRPGGHPCLPKKARHIMLNWLKENRDNPYPSEEQKAMLVEKTNLTYSQLNYWFVNARRRVLPKWRQMEAQGYQIQANLLSDSECD